MGDADLSYDGLVWNRDIWPVVDVDDIISREGPHFKNDQFSSQVRSTSDALLDSNLLLDTSFTQTLDIGSKDLDVSFNTGENILNDCLEKNAARILYGDISKENGRVLLKFRMYDHIVNQEKVLCKLCDSHVESTAFKSHDHEIRGRFVLSGEFVMLEINSIDDNTRFYQQQQRPSTTLPSDKIISSHDLVKGDLMKNTDFHTDSLIKNSSVVKSDGSLHQDIIKNHTMNISPVNPDSHLRAHNELHRHPSDCSKVSDVQPVDVATVDRILNRLESRFSDSPELPLLEITSKRSSEKSAVCVSEPKLKESADKNEYSVSPVTSSPRVESKPTETNDQPKSDLPFSCTQCSKSYSTRRTLNKHMLSHTNQKFPCLQCDKTFTRLDRLRRHQYNHASVKPYVCAECNKEFARKEYLHAHMSTHNGEKPYQCDICGYRFNLRSNFVMHKRVHQVMKPHVCPVCNRGFGRLDHLEAHKLQHTGEKPMICEICGKRFAEQEKLTRHKQVHSSVAKYSCDVCFRRFKRKDSRDVHKKTHALISSHSCTVCLKMFNREHQLSKHLKLHEDKTRIQCMVCLKFFLRGQKYTLHVRKHSHESEKRKKVHECEMCMKPFARPNVLRAHMKKVHNQILPSPARIMNNKPRSFQCHVCNRYFTRNQTLKAHVHRVHETPSTLQTNYAQFAAPTFLPTQNDLQTTETTANYAMAYAIPQPPQSYAFPSD